LQNEATKAKKEKERIRKLARERRKTEDPDATDSSGGEDAGGDADPFEDEDFFDAFYTPAPRPSEGVGPSGAGTAATPPHCMTPFDAAVSGSGSSSGARSPQSAPGPSPSSEAAPRPAPPAGAATTEAPSHTSVAQSSQPGSDTVAGQGLVRVVSAPRTTK
jgi:hypothetical protein